LHCHPHKQVTKHVTGEFLVTKFGLREKEKMELNKESFTEKVTKHRK
jgi:hypothetical protein